MKRLGVLRGAHSRFRPSRLAVCPYGYGFKRPGLVTISLKARATGPFCIYMTETIPAPAADLDVSFAFGTADTFFPATEPALAETLGLAHATSLLTGLKAHNSNLNPIVASF